MLVLNRIKRAWLARTGNEDGPTLEITVTFPCVNACSFCPQDKWRGAYQGENRLTYDEFCKLLERIPRRVRLEFSGFSEPFANREAALMMREAHRRGYRVGLFTTLVGLREEDVQTIKNVPFYPCNLHLPDDVNFKVRDEERWLRSFRLFAKHVIFDNAVYHIGKLSPAVMREVDRVHLYPTLTRANNVDPDVANPLARRTGPIGCTASKDRFDRNVMMPNGDVYLCCMDWSLEHRLGSLATQSYEELFQGEQFRVILRGMNDESVESICRYCEWSCKDAARQGEPPR